MTSAPASDPSREEWRRIRSLFEQALERAEEERAAFLAERCAGNTRLRAEVERLLELDRQPGSALDGATPVGLGKLREAASAGEGRRIGPYTLRRQIGTGGMGNVWLAVQTEGSFHRRVALKLLHRGMESAELLARFQRERQVLANLDHPGIARLIDGGVSESGEPYLVMEYVEGQRIDRWCDGQRLGVEQRLELFRKVCEAVQHAHQRLVVHRDIKPGNILVTAEGAPKLLDFGIAKVLDPEKQASGVEVTREVMRFFTPAYASPEQVQGLPVTTASDIYSLGVLLYQLLAGRLPQRRTGSEAGPLAGASAAQEPERPSLAVRRVDSASTGRPAGEDEAAVDAESIGRLRSTTSRMLARRLAGDLDRIVMKALRPEPLRRYPTVHELAEDVRRTLAGLPISARPDSALYRASRFARRNRLAVACAGVALLSLCGGTVALWREYRQSLRAGEAESERSALAQEHARELEGLNARLEERGQELERQKLALEGAVQQGEELRQGLEQARAQSETRLQESRRYVTKMMFDVLQKLYALEGGAEASRLLVQASLDHLDRLSADSGDDSGLRRDLVKAYLQMARFQGDLYITGWKDYPKAIETAEKASELAQGLLVDGEPANPADRLLFSSIELVRGDAARRSSRTELALGSYAMAIEYCEPFATAVPPNAEGTYALSAACSRSGELLAEQGHTEEAREQTARALDLLLAMLEHDPRNGSYREDVSILYGQLGSLELELGQHEEALRLARLSLEMAEQLALEQPGNSYYARQAQNARFWLGYLLGQQGLPEEARQLYAEALGLAQQIYAADPRNEQAARDVVQISLQSAGIELQAGRPEAAAGLLESALPAARGRVERLPKDWLAKIELAQLRLELGRCHRRLGRTFEAGGDMSRTAELLEELWEPGRGESTFARMYAQTAHNLGLGLIEVAKTPGTGTDRGRAVAAAKHWLQRSEQLFNRLIGESGGLQLDRDLLAISKEELGKIDAIDPASFADQ